MVQANGQHKLKEHVKLVNYPMRVISPGEGGTPLYELYGHVLPQRVWFLSHFGLKMGIDFDHYGLKLGLILQGST